MAHTYIYLCINSVQWLSHVQLFVTPWTVTHQAPPSVGFSRQEYWSGLPFPSPGDLPDPGIRPRSPALADTLNSEPPGKPLIYILSSVQSHSCPTLCNSMNLSTPGLPAHHQLLESTQNHVHRVGDAIQPSHPLLSRSPPAPNPSQH